MTATPPAEDPGTTASSNPTAADPAFWGEGWGNRLRFILLLVLLGFLFVASLALGSARVDFTAVFRILLGGLGDLLGLAGEPPGETWRHIVLQVRLPRTLTAVLAGSALAVSGLQMQTLFGNPLAGPYVLGISSGASLGVAALIMSTGGWGTGILQASGLFGSFALAAAAMMGSGLVMGMVLLIAVRIPDNLSLLILGLMVGYVVSALVSVLLYTGSPEMVQSFTLWSFGTFSQVNEGHLWILVPVVLVGMGLFVPSIKSMNALLLGQNYARTLGVSVRRIRVSIILSAAILAGGVTAFCGPIAFIGLAVPHLCRGILRTSDHHTLFRGCLVVGAAVALAADITARVPFHALTLPLNAITAFLGAPVVITVLARRQALG